MFVVVVVVVVLRHCRPKTDGCEMKTKKEKACFLLYESLSNNGMQRNEGNCNQWVPSFTVAQKCFHLSLSVTFLTFCDGVQFKNLKIDLDPFSHSSKNSLETVIASLSLLLYPVVVVVDTIPSKRPTCFPFALPA